MKASRAGKIATCIYLAAAVQVRNSYLLSRKKQSKRNKQLLRRESQEVLFIWSYVAGQVNKMACKKL